MKKVVSILIGIVEIIIGLSLLLLLLLAIVQRFSKDGNLFGYRIFTVASGSMKPLFQIGDALVIKEVNIEDINEGDIVTYKAKNSKNEEVLITHKVMQKGMDNDKYYFYTQGIANEVMDPLVSEDQIMGKVVYKIFILSLIGRATSDGASLFVFITIPVTILIVIEIFKILLGKDKEVKEEYSD